MGHRQCAQDVICGLDQGVFEGVEGVGMGWVGDDLNHIDFSCVGKARHLSFAEDGWRLRTGCKAGAEEGNPVGPKTSHTQPP